MSAQAVSSDEQHLKHLESAWDEALARHDAGAIAHLVTDDYQVTDVNGHVHDKSKILQVVATVDQKLKPYCRDDVRVRIDGDTAMITGRITWGNHNGNGHGNGNGHVDARARYLKLYVRRDDGWKALVARATRITER